MSGTDAEKMSLETIEATIESEWMGLIGKETVIKQSKATFHNYEFAQHNLIDRKDKESVKQNNQHG